MADVFLSYASHDRARVAPLVEILRGRGWDVWWDRHIPAGEDWASFIEGKLGEARCVVVLWSDGALASEWVAREAHGALERNVVVQALLEQVDPPAEFRWQQLVDLIDWDGAADAPEALSLIRAIEALLTELALTPTSLVLVTGDPQRYEDMGPTINLVCRVTNGTKEPVAINRLLVDVSADGRRLFEMSWHLFYDVRGLEHSKAVWEPITVQPESVWQRGVQFRETVADVANVWPAGTYDFELLGWAERNPSRQGANLRTTFTAEVSPSTEEMMRHTRAAPPASWDEWEAQGTVSDRAIGFPLYVHDVVVS